MGCVKYNRCKELNILKTDYRKKITLIRHGKPDFWDAYSSGTIIPGAELKKIADDYDSSSILPEPAPSDELINSVKNAGLCFRSDLRRAVKSSERLGLTNIITGPLFREIELPHGILNNIRFSIKTWFIILRVLWFLGISSNCESRKKSETRAGKAAEKIIEASEENEHVVLVAHGFINRFIGKQLKKRGWKQIEKSDSYWGRRSFIIS